MSDTAYLIVHLKLIDGGDDAKPYRVGIYSDDQDSLTSIGNESLACIASAKGTSYQEACDLIIERIAYNVTTLGLRSNLRWVMPLMDQRNVDDINEKIEEIHRDSGSRFELENGGSQPKPR
jgi:hypothetical protein